jgi:hypothetical protein
LVRLEEGVAKQKPMKECEVLHDRRRVEARPTAGPTDIGDDHEIFGSLAAVGAPLEGNPVYPPRPSILHEKPSGPPVP